MTAQPVRLPLPGLPEQCPHCGTGHTEWPLTVYGGLVSLTCLTCYQVVAPVRVVAIGSSGEPCEDCGAPEDSASHDPASIDAHQYAAEARTGGRRHRT